MRFDNSVKHMIFCRKPFICTFFLFTQISHTFVLVNFTPSILLIDIYFTFKSCLEYNYLRYGVIHSHGCHVRANSQICIPRLVKESNEFNSILIYSDVSKYHKLENRKIVDKPHTLKVFQSEVENGRNDVKM